MKCFTDDERINYYSNNISPMKYINNKFGLEKSLMNTLNCYNYNIFKATIENSRLGLPHYHNTYTNKMRLVMECNEEYKDKMFLSRFGDSTVFEDIDCPYFTKARQLNDKNGVILCFNKSRHWGLLGEVRLHDIPFINKKNKTLVWRGVTTGPDSNRLFCVSQYFNNPLCNIGFTRNVQKKNYASKFFKPQMSVKQQLQHKYILSLEGNDVASGLKWQLYSNSVVFMRKPRKVSWAMEDKLIPYIHYIPLKDDFSDVVEQIQWAENNQEKCVEISQNATHFIEQFLDGKRETNIEISVMRKYFENIDIV